MLTFLKYLLQLVLSPGHGWEDIERESPDAEELLRRGLYPLLGVTAASEFLAFIYMRHASFGSVLVRAVSDFGCYFVAVFIARLIFDLYLGKMCDVRPEQTRIGVFTVCGIGLMVLIQLLSNCLPWNLVLLKFLPVYVVLILYKGARYMDVRKNDMMRFTALSALAVVAVPLAIYYLLYLLIQ